MTIDIKKLESSLDSRDFDSVKKMIQGAVDGDMSNVERGEAYIGLSESYLDAMNKLNDNYKAVLKEAVEGMEQLKKAGARIDEEIRIAEIKSDL